ncbi:DUF2877 domain-containing protein [Clostridium sp. E02]|uniref:DUF2877 domain-containing protein n=1 Tax=Clostridium sp. E02 TaxID=2487134 RepID=UPI000F547D27|nr:DUF2877 domain-containing protein [Clostridium sp. E02]
MEKRIIRMSGLVKEILNRQIGGYVHSIYRKTINLCFADNLVAIQSNGTHLSPLSIIIDADELDMSSACVLKGDKVEVTANGMIISGMNIKEENTEVVPLKLDKEKIEQSNGFFLKEDKRLYDGIIQLMEEKKVLDLFFDNGQSVGRTPISLYAEKYIQNSIQSLVRKDYNQTAQELIGIIGLGNGLTPSGDDFLCGLLAGLTYNSKKKEVMTLLSALKVQIAENRNRTNDISGAFLKCAIDGYYSEAVLKIPTQTNSAGISKLFSEIGHSSGADTLCGIYFSVQLISYL